MLSNILFCNLTSYYPYKKIRERASKATENTAVLVFSVVGVGRITKWRRKSLHAVVYPVNCDKNKYTFFKHGAGAALYYTAVFSRKILPKFQDGRKVYW